jgi:hypothetical protein
VDPGGAGRNNRTALVAPRARSHCRVARPVINFTRYTNRFGASLSETPPRPNPVELSNCRRRPRSPIGSPWATWPRPRPSPSAPPAHGAVPLAFPAANRVCLAVFHGRAERLFRAGQFPEALEEGESFLSDASTDYGAAALKTGAVCHSAL